MSAIVLDENETDLRRIVQSIIQLTQGRNNAVGEVTLALNQTTTVVSAINCGIDSKPQLTPLNSAAASEANSTFVSAVDQGSFTITHPSNGTTRIWGWHTPG